MNASIEAKNAERVEGNTVKFPGSTVPKMNSRCFNRIFTRHTKSQTNSNNNQILYSSSRNSATLALCASDRFESTVIFERIMRKIYYIWNYYYKALPQHIFICSSLQRSHVCLCKMAGLRHVPCTLILDLTLLFCLFILYLVHDELDWFSSWQAYTYFRGCNLILCHVLSFCFILTAAFQSADSFSTAGWFRQTNRHSPHLKARFSFTIVLGFGASEAYASICSLSYWGLKVWRFEEKRM